MASSDVQGTWRGDDGPWPCDADGEAEAERQKRIE